MRKQEGSGNTFQYVLMAAFAIIRWGALRLRELKDAWLSERKKPAHDRQKIDRRKAVTSLLAIAIAVAAVAFYVLKGFIVAFANAAGVIDRQTALYIGVAALFLGLQVFKRLPKRRKLGLVISTLGALLVAYGFGYI
jgi:hypothetical protein